jgi:hypothetical protein
MNLETCYACGKKYHPNGLIGLCSRQCCNELTLYSYSTSAYPNEPLNPNLVKYHLKFWNTGDIHLMEDVQLQIENLRPEELAFYNAYEISEANAIKPKEYPPQNEEASPRYYFKDLPKCGFCADLVHPLGWTDLCSRRCFYGLRNLLDSFEKGETSVPDDRVISYFDKHPDKGGHRFEAEKIFAFIENNCSNDDKVYEWEQWWFREGQAECAPGWEPDVAV